GTAYNVRVAARNHNGYGAWSTWLPFTTKNNVPTPPQNVTVSDIGDDTATVSWTAPANLLGSTIQSYTIRTALNPTFSQDLKTYTVTGPTLSRALTGLFPAMKHYVQVWSNSSNG